MNEPMWYETMLAALEREQFRRGNDSICLYGSIGNRIELKDAPRPRAYAPIAFRIVPSNLIYASVYEADTDQFICALDRETVDVVVGHALRYNLAIKGVISTYGAGVTEWDSSGGEDEDDEEEEEEGEEEEELNLRGLHWIEKQYGNYLFHPLTKERLDDPRSLDVLHACAESPLILHAPREDGFTPVLCACHRLVRCLLSEAGRRSLETWMEENPGNNVEMIEVEAATTP